MGNALILRWITRRVSNVSTLLYYGVAAYLALGIISYGLAWREFMSTPDSVLLSGGRVINGKIRSLRSTGFGKNRDYFMEVEGSTEELMIPASVANSLWMPSSTPALYLKDVVHEGDPVSIRTSGGKPVVLELILKKDGEAPQEIMSYGESASRYSQTLKRANWLGMKYILLGILFLPLAFGLRLGFYRYVRPRLFLKK